MGSLDHPFNPVSLALGAEATFVGRGMDSDRAGLTAVLDAAARHRGASLVEIYQDCPIFNDGSFDVLRKPGQSDSRVITVRHGEPITFGNEGQYAVVRRGFGLAVAPTAGVAPKDVVVHDATDHELSFALSRLSDQGLDHAVFGVLRQVVRPTYDDLTRAQVQQAVDGGGADLLGLLHGRDTWTVHRGAVLGGPSSAARPEE
jgi:2-oxoglutarate ferredoxin oxidoreductase subunit beta